MNFRSLANTIHRLDPKNSIAYEGQYLKKCIAQAQLEQSDRHHTEKMRLESMKLDANRDQANAQIEREREQTRAIIEREKIAGQNALDLADRSHILGQLAQGSQLIDSMIHSELKQEEDWNAVFSDTMRGLILSEADLIKQERLRELEHRHKMEEMTLNFNLKFIEMFLQNEIQDQRVEHDKMCDIIFRVVERALGLGEQQVSQSDVSQWVSEAMGQAYK